MERTPESLPIVTDNPNQLATTPLSHRRDDFPIQNPPGKPATAQMTVESARDAAQAVSKSP